MKRTIVFAALALALYVPPSGAATKDQIMAAAALAGMLSGMAGGCDLDGKPVLLAYRRVLDSSNFSPAERRDAEEAVASAAGLGLSSQSKLGAMPCDQVKQRLDRGIRQIKSLE